MNSKIIKHKHLIRNARALGVSFKKGYQEKQFIAVLILAVIALSIPVGIHLALEALKKLFAIK